MNKTISEGRVPYSKLEKDSDLWLIGFSHANININRIFSNLLGKQGAFEHTEECTERYQDC